MPVLLWCTEISPLDIFPKDISTPLLFRIRTPITAKRYGIGLVHFRFRLSHLTCSGFSGRGNVLPHQGENARGNVLVSIRGECPTFVIIGAYCNLYTWSTAVFNDQWPMIPLFEFIECRKLYLGIDLKKAW